MSPTRGGSLNSDKEGSIHHFVMQCYNLCCLRIEFRVSQQVYLYKLTWEISLVILVTILAASSWAFSS